MLLFIGQSRTKFPPAGIILSSGTYWVPKLPDELDTIQYSLMVSDFWYFVGFAKPDGIRWTSLCFIELEWKL